MALDVTVSFRVFVGRAREFLYVDKSQKSRAVAKAVSDFANDTSDPLRGEIITGYVPVRFPQLRIETKGWTLVIGKMPIGREKRDAGWRISFTESYERAWVRVAN